MTGSVPVLDDQDAKKAIAQEKSRRRDLIDRLRSLVTDAQAVERLVADDFARADREISRRG